MFGIFNEAKTEEKKNVGESVYGGYGGHLDYERFRRERNGSRLAKASRALATGCLVIAFGVTGVIGGMMIYEMIDENRFLYFPRGSMPDETLQEQESASSNGSVFLIGETVSSGNIQNVTAEISRRYRIPIGVMISEVEPTSAAGLAGMESGDIIVAVNSVEISDIASLDRLIHAATGSVELKVFRDNRYHTILWTE